MKRIIKVLKAFMLFVTAIWGFVLGVFGSVVMLADKNENPLPKSFYAAWLIISVFGFITPCFLVMLKKYKSAAALSVVGGIAVVVLHTRSVNKAAPLYLPLLTETLAAVIIAVITRKRKTPLKNKDAPAPSVLGNGYYEHKRNSKTKGGK